MLFLRKTTRLKILLISTFQVFIVAANVVAQQDAPKFKYHNDNIRFTTYSVEQGLSHPVVQGIAQDQQGFIWFGTKDGLNRFDGYRFVVYRHDPQNQNSLSDNEIRHMIVDRSGFLWIGTLLGGLNRYDPKSETFTRFLHHADDKNSISANHVEHIYEDSAGIIWIGTARGGLNRFDPTTNNFTRFQHNPNDPGSLPNSTIVCIAEDRDGTLWIGTDNPYPGLHRMDKKSERFVHYYHDPENPFSLSKAVNIRTIFDDHAGNLWIGTHFGGLDRYDRSKDQFIHVKDYPNAVVSSAIKDKNDNIWFSSNNGLVKFDPQATTFTLFKHDRTDAFSVGGDTTIRLFRDRSGLIWVGTFGNGVSVFDPSPKLFRHYRKALEPSQGLIDNDVRGLFVEDSGVIWIGGWSGALTRFDPQSMQFSHFRPNPSDPESISSGNRLRALHVDQDGILWCGNWNNGLDRLDPESGKFSHYRHDPQNPDSLSVNRISCMTEDRNGHLWIGTVNGGLNKFDKKTRRFARYQHVPGVLGTLSDNQILVIYEDQKGLLWIGTWSGGLNKFDPQTEKFEAYQNDPSDPASIAANKIFAITEDRNNKLWVGTTGGLCQYDASQNRFKCYNTNDGLPSNLIYGILSDDDGGFLWLSTSNGLSKFDLQSRSIKNYDASDGLQNAVFNPGACFKSSSGEFFFGGINGLNAFFPDQIKASTFIPPVVLTNFQLFNTPVPVAAHSMLPQSIGHTHRLSLSHKDAVLSFSFASLAYAAPHKNKYAYIMEGIDTDWNLVDSTRRFVTYTNLAPGEYAFKVRGTNSDGIWNPKATTIKLMVAPPVWRTWWFIGLATLSIAALLVAFHRTRTNHARKHNLALKAYNEELNTEIAVRKKAEAEMARLRKLLKNIIDSMPSSLVAVDKNGGVTQWNREAERITGIPARAAIGRRLHDVFPLLTTSLKNVEKAIHERLPQRIEKFVWQQNNSTHYSDLTVYPLITNGTDGAVLRVDDVTDRIQAEKEKQELELRLLQAQKMEAIGTLAGGIAHDFNNILSAIIGFSELLELELASDDQSLQIIKQILKASNRARKLVQQILTFSRQGKQVFKPVKIDQIVRDALKFIRASLPTTIDIQLQVQCDDLIEGDPTQLHQVFLNLCTNAAHAMEENGGVLTIALQRAESKAEQRQPELKRGNYVHIRVKDTGQGMPPRTLKRIFDPFFTTKEKDKGTGMGLSVVHGIVDNHRGIIQVSSEPGQGTAFDIYLPVLAIGTEEIRSTQENIPTGTERILFVDDEENLAQLGKELLESLGYVVVIATSSEKALALFEAQPDRFDLVITDMTMPEMTGDALARSMISIRSDIPVILCTGFSTKIAEDQALHMGIRAFLIKPIVRSKLSRIVRKVLDSPADESS